MRLLPTEIIYSGAETKFGNEPLEVSSTRIPFEMKVESTQPFNVLDAGYEYSHAGFRIYFKRSKIVGILSAFYGPTGLFGFLSMISFCINPDVVSEYFLIHVQYNPAIADVKIVEKPSIVEKPK